MSPLRSLLVGALVVLGVSVVRCPSAVAATVGTGDLTVDVSLATSTYTGAIVFDNHAFDLFGVPVNVGQDVGTENVSGEIALEGLGGTFTAHAESDPGSNCGVSPGEFCGDAAGGFICQAAAPFGCTSGPVSFVGTFSTLSGTVTSSWPGGLAYTFDGTVTFVAFTGAVYQFTGRIAFNAFQPVSTATSPPGCSGSACAVVVTPAPTSIVNSATGQEVVLDASITFPVVTAAGDTTVTAVSNVAGQLQANFAFNDDVTYVDVSTTAAVGSPIEVCVNYAIAGTVADPLALRLMHLEGCAEPAPTHGCAEGVWVDVTSRLDTTTQTICGRTTSLSPFGVAVRTGCTTDADCDDSNPCSSDACDVGTCVHAAANAGGTCRPAVSECDAAETCDGASTACPPNGFATGAGCTDDGDTCTDDKCDESGACTHPSNGSCTATTTTSTTKTSTTTSTTEEPTTTTSSTTTKTATTTTSTTAPQTTSTTSTTTTTTKTTTTTTKTTTTTTMSTTTTKTTTTTTKTTTTTTKTTTTTTTSTTTTSTKTTTTTTLLACGGVFPQCNGSCPVGMRCSPFGRTKSCACR